MNVAWLNGMKFKACDNEHKVIYWHLNGGDDCPVCSAVEAKTLDAEVAYLQTLRDADNWRLIAKFVKDNDTRGGGVVHMADDDIVQVVLTVLRQRVKDVKRENEERKAWFGVKDGTV